MKKTVFLVLLCLTIYVSAQRSSRYGIDYDPYGEFRVLTVFADFIDDTVEYSVNELFPWWPEGSLPTIANDIFDYNSGGSLSGFVTKYYYEASFGTFLVLGDYYPFLIQLRRGDVGNIIGLKAVRDYLNSQPESDTVTYHGYGFSQFDNYGFASRIKYIQTIHSADNRIDMINIIWRRNRKEYPLPSGGGTVCFRDADNNTLKSFDGINGYSKICHEHPDQVFRHEFAHRLIGGNNYHNGGAGTGDPGNFLSNISGYSMLGSYNANLESYNGWDRWWLGWKHPSKQHYISAVDANGNEVATDLTYGEPLAANEFILRNFAEYGDVVRIKLPHIRTLDNRIRNQYLWIENHQIKPGTVEYAPEKAKGIRFNIQVGNDNLEGDFDSSRTNYYVPLSAFGNYDFFYAPFDTTDTSLHWYNAYTTPSQANPLTGYHPSMLPAIDARLKKSSVDDTIQSNEFVTVRRIYMDSVSVCGFLPVFGNSYDAFPIGASLRMCSNPPNVPLITYKTAKRETDEGQANNPATPSYDDNRHLWLNGLRVDIVEQYIDGSIKVRVTWNDYDVDNDVRWCGPIMLKERLILQNHRTMRLDYGQTPTRPYNPVVIGERKVFADPTVFTCLSGSYLCQNPSSKVVVANQSAMVIENGAEYVVEDGAVLDVQTSGSLVIKSGATLHVKGSGRVEIREGGHLCVENGAHIILENNLSVVNLHNGSQQGINPVHETLSADCADIRMLRYTGLGQVNEYSGITYIQNRVFSDNSYKTGETINAGHHVTTNATYGNVTVESGATVVLDAEGNVNLQPGVEVKLGGTLIAR